MVNKDIKQKITLLKWEVTLLAVLLITLLIIGTSIIGEKAKESALLKETVKLERSLIKVLLTTLDKQADERLEINKYLYIQGGISVDSLMLKVERNKREHENKTLPRQI